MYTLPTDFLATPPPAEGGYCRVFPYQSERRTDRAQVFLEMHAISFLQEGEKAVLFPQQKAVCRAGQLLLMKRGRCLMTEKTSAAGRYASWLVFFDDAFLGTFLHKYGLQPPGLAALSSHQVLDAHAELDLWAASMQPYLHAPARLSPELAHLQGEAALLHLVQAHGDQALSLLMSRPEQQNDLALRRTVEQHPTLSAGELAFLCHMSEPTFRRHFRRIYGQPPAQWLTQHRLEQAARQLRYEGQTPSEVALRVGFQSLSSFGQAFKRHFGQTPSQYQQAHRSDSKSK